MSISGNSVTAQGVGTKRFGPAKKTGDMRSAKTASIRIVMPRIGLEVLLVGIGSSTMNPACPIQVVFSCVSQPGLSRPHVGVRTCTSLLLSVGIGT